MRGGKIRVLHVIPGLLRTGGVGIWLRSVLRWFDTARYTFDFMPKAYRKCPPEASAEEELLGYGGRIHQCEELRWPFPMGGSLRRVLRESYDVIHEHNLCEGSVLWEAKRAGIRHRIAHVHNDVRAALTSGRWGGRMLRRFQTLLTKRCSTRGFACSDLVGSSHFGRGWGRDPRWRRLFYGIDFAPYDGPVDSASVRAQLGLPVDAFVVGNVGRLAAQKNHSFVLRVFAEILRIEKTAWLLCVGDGPDRASVVRSARELGVGERVVLPGGRNDVPRLLLGAMDVFLFPSHYEGFGIALLEAQAAGLPCVLSDVIPPQTDVVGSLMHRLSLQQDPRVWAELVTHLWERSSDLATRKLALERMKQSPFSIERSAQTLVQEYEEMLETSGRA